MDIYRKHLLILVLYFCAGYSPLHQPQAFSHVFPLLCALGDLSSVVQHSLVWPKAGTIKRDRSQVGGRRGEREKESYGFLPHSLPA